MNDGMQILLIAKLNETLSEANINKQLQKLKINSLKINLEVDQGRLDALNNIVKNMDKIKLSQKQMNEVVREHTTITKELDGSITKVTQSTLKTGETIQKTTNTQNKQKKAIDDTVKSANKLAEEFKHMGDLERESIKRNAFGVKASQVDSYRKGYTQTIVNSNDKGQVTSVNTILNHAKEKKALEAEAEATRKLTQARKELLKQTVELSRKGGLKKSDLADLARTINTSANKSELDNAVSKYQNLMAIQKAYWQNQANNRQKDIEQANRLHQLEVKQNKAKLNIQNLQTRYGNKIDGEGLKRYLDTINNLTVKTPHLTRELDRLDISLKQIEADARKAASQGKTLGEQFSSAFSKFSVWMGAGTVFYGAVNAVQDLYQNMVLLDSQFTQLRRVSEEGTSFDEIFKGAADQADDLGQKVSSIYDALAGFAQQGNYSELELLDLSQTATIASNVSDLKIDESMSDIVSAMVQFNIEAENSISIVDKLNETDNNFAVTTRNLAQGIHKAGSAAKTYGVTIDELVGHLTAIGSATRESGNITGNSLKSIYSRLGSDDSIRELKGIGIEMINLDGTTKNASEALGELAGKWGGLSNTQQQNLAVTVAGRYQLTRFLALMENWDIAMNATNTSLNSEGSAMRENAEYMKSMQAQINRMSAAWEALSVVIGDAGVRTAIIAVVKSITFMINGFAELTRASSGWLTIWLPLIALLGGVGAALIRVRVEAIKAGTAVKFFRLSFGWMAAAFVGLELLMSAFMGATGSAHENSKALAESALQNEQTANKVGDLVKRYEELKPQASNSAKAHEELKDVMRQIQEISPSLVSAYDAQGNALEINTTKAKQFADSIKLMSEKQREAAKVEIGSLIVSQTTAVAEKKAEYEEAIKDNETYHKTLLTMTKRYGARDVVELQAILKEKSDAKDQAAKNDLAIFERLNSLISENGGMEAYESWQSAQATLDVYKQQGDALNGVSTASKQVAYVNGEVSESYDGVGDSVEGATESINVYKGAINKAYEAYDTASEKVKTYNEILSQLDDGQEITADSAIEWMKTNKDLIGVFEIVGNRVNVNREALNKLRDAQIDATNKSIAAQNAEVTAANNKLVKLLNNYGLQIKGINSVIEAQNALAGIDKTIDDIFNNGSPQDRYNIPELIGAKNQAQDVLQYFQEIEALKSAVPSGLSSVGYSGGGSKDKEKAEEKYATNVFEQKMSRIDAEIKSLQTLRGQYDENSQEYRNNISKEIKLLQQKQALGSQEANRLRAENARLAKIGDNESRKQIDDNLKTIDALGKAYWELKDSVSELTSQHLLSQFHQSFAKTNQEIEKLEKNIRKLDSEMEASNFTMSQYPETSREYREEMVKQGELLKEKAKYYQQEIAAMEAQNKYISSALKNNKYPLEVQKELKEQLKNNEQAIEDYTDAWLEGERAVKANSKAISDLDTKLAKERYNAYISATEKMADETVAIMKEAIEKQKEHELDAIEELEEAEDKRHEKKMEQYDDEQKRFEDNINKQLKALDKQEQQEDYEKNLTKLQKERAELQSNIDRLSLDDSFEAQAKRKELLDQLEQKDEEIGELTSNRNRELRKQNLQETLDEYNKDMDNKKELEDEKHETVKESLEKQREELESHYDEILEDEARWSKVRTDIINGDVKTIQSTLNQFVADFGVYIEANTGKIGKHVNDTISLVERLKQVTNGLPQVGTPTKPSDSFSSPLEEYVRNGVMWWMSDDAGRSTLSKRNGELRGQYSEFGNLSFEDVQQKYPELVSKIMAEAQGEYVKKKLEYIKTTDSSKKSQLGKILEGFRGQFGIQDYTLSDIMALFPELAKAQGFDTGGYTGAWGSGGKLAVVHEKELMLNKDDTSNFLKALDLAKGLFETVKTPVMKFMPNMLKNKETETPPINVEVTIEKLVGDEKGAKTLFDTLGGALQKKGVTFRNDR